MPVQKGCISGGQTWSGSVSKISLKVHYLFLILGAFFNHLQKLDPHERHCAAGSEALGEGHIMIACVGSEIPTFHRTPHNTIVVRMA